MLHTLGLFLHLIALALWLGGMAFFLIVFGPAAQTLSPGTSLKVLNRGRAQFEALSWAGIGLLFITGILNLSLRAQTTPLGEFYIALLGVKLLFFIAMVIAHAAQVFKYGPKITALTEEVADNAEFWPESLHSYWTKWFTLLKVNATLGPITTLFGLALITH